jgi:hypothetical protein
MDEVKRDFESKPVGSVYAGKAALPPEVGDDPVAHKHGPFRVAKEI